MDNWDEPRTVTVSAAEDNDASNDTATVSHRVSGYGSVTTAASVTVTVTDNDFRRILPPVIPITDEGSTSGSTGSSSSAPTGRDPRFVEGARAIRSVEANAEPGTPWVSPCGP